jgi:hypothetical protein
VHFLLDFQKSYPSSYHRCNLPAFAVHPILSGTEDYRLGNSVQGLLGSGQSETRRHAPGFAIGRSRQSLQYMLIMATGICRVWASETSAMDVF